VRVRERRMLEHDLRTRSCATSCDWCIQPQQESRAGKLSGFEALLRWKNPMRGDISPAVFIPIAEGNRSYSADWRLVLRQPAASRHVKQPLKIAINVSAVQFYNDKFVQELHQMLLEIGLPPHRLEMRHRDGTCRDFNRALSMLATDQGARVRIAMGRFR